MDIGGNTRICGLIGNPVEHSKSPLIHNTIADAMGEDLKYVLFRVDEKAQLEDAIKGAYALNIQGLNITVPYKSDVIPFLKELDPLAERIGAVNTLVRIEGGFKGFNTDMPGLYRALSEDGVKIEGEDVVVLGAGGAARAVCMMLAERNVGRVFLLNRTIERAEAVANEINGLHDAKIIFPKVLDWYKDIPEGKKYIVIQATSVGMVPHPEGVIIEDEGFYNKVSVGYDIIFNPRETRFMKLVKAHGGEAYNGAKMLLYQGVIAHELWTGIPVPFALAAKAYEKMYGEV